MRFLRVRYQVCQTQATVPESFVEDFNALVVNENEERWVFWSPDPKETPETLRSKGNEIIKVGGLIRQNQRAMGAVGYYLARIMFIRDSMDDINKCLDQEGRGARQRSQINASKPQKKELEQSKSKSATKCKKNASHEISLNDLFKPDKVKQIPSIEELFARVQALEESASSRRDLEQELVKANSRIVLLEEDNQALRDRNGKLMDSLLQLHLEQKLFYANTSSLNIPSTSQAASDCTENISVASTNFSLSTAQTLSMAVPASSTPLKMMKRSLPLTDTLSETQPKKNKPVSESLSEVQQNVVIYYENQDVTESPVENILESPSLNNHTNTSHMEQSTETEQQETSNYCVITGDDGFYGSPAVSGGSNAEERCISEAKFREAMQRATSGPKGDSVFIRELTEELWTRSELAVRSCTGLPSHNGIQIATKKCTPSKVQKLKDSLTRRVQMENLESEDDQRKRIAQLNKLINGKIKSVRLYKPKSGPI